MMSILILGNINKNLEKLKIQLLVLLTNKNPKKMRGFQIEYFPIGMVSLK